MYSSGMESRFPGRCPVERRCPVAKIWRKSLSLLKILLSGASAPSGPTTRRDIPRRVARMAPKVSGYVLFSAAVLKTRQFAEPPYPAMAPHGGTWFETMLTAWEIFLGLWLISGALPVAARRVAIGCFSLFGIYAFYEALAGKADCGCFGQVRVNPWFTFILDVSVVLALTFLGKPRTQKAGPSQWAQRKWPVAAAAERLCFKE